MTSAGKKMVVLRALAQTKCPSAVEQDVMVLAASIILEVAKKDATGITTKESAVDAIAALLPDTTTFADRLPQEMARVVEECASFHMPRSASETRATDATIRIIDREKELDNDKYCTVGGMKLWKNPEAPNTIFYAHCWLGKTFTEWKCTYDTYVRGSTVTEIHIHRQRCCEQLLMTWFDMTKTVTRIEDLTPANVKMFQTAIELLAEGYLLRKGISTPDPRQALTKKS